MAKTFVKDRPCATEGCENPAKLRLEVGGVSSDYCPECYAKIDLDAPPAPEALTVLDQPLDGPAPEAEGATGADTTEGGAEPDPAAAPVVTQGLLRDLIAKIEARNTDLHRNALFYDLVELHRAVDIPSGEEFTLAGISVARRGVSDKQMLTNWCCAARRAILSGAIPE